MEQPSATRAAALLSRLDRGELRMCLALNRAVGLVGLRRLFQLASRLGDGVVWYALILSLPLMGGREALAVSVRMALAGLGGLLLYRFLKRRLVRERPFVTHDAIRRSGVPLDRFSFPSGHTLHAASLTIIAVSAYPQLAIVLVPLAVLIALSRVVLGLHYPSDVAAGALIGFGVARLTEALPFA